MSRLPDDSPRSSSTTAQPPAQNFLECVRSATDITPADTGITRHTRSSGFISMLVGRKIAWDRKKIIVGTRRPASSSPALFGRRIAGGVNAPQSPNSHNLPRPARAGFFRGWQAALPCAVAGWEHGRLAGCLPAAAGTFSVDRAPIRRVCLNVPVSA